MKKIAKLTGGEKARLFGSGMGAISNAIMSFVIDTDDVQELKNFVNTLDVFSIGVSCGRHEFIVHAPAIAYLKEMIPKQFKTTGLSLGVIRISVGLENPNDLIADLDNALASM